jgi:predicted transcriptional regulator of viral defense system
MRTSQLRKAGLDSRTISSLLEDGFIYKIKDGYYVYKNYKDQLSDYQIATATISNATICFTSAASFYSFTTLIPDVIYLAIPNIGREPKRPIIPPIEFIQYKPALFHLGRCELEEDSIIIPIYDKERTVCDCFKRRNEIGNDIAIEILKNYMHGKKDIPKLYVYAEKLRIQNKLNPYVEALL